MHAAPNNNPADSGPHRPCNSLQNRRRVASDETQGWANIASKARRSADASREADAGCDDSLKPVLLTRRTRGLRGPFEEFPPRIKEVAQSVAEEVEPQHEYGNREPRKNRDVRCIE